MEHQNNQNGNVNGNDHKHDDYDLDQQRYRGRDEQNTRNYQNPQQEYSQFQRQDRQRDFSQSQRANQRYVNGVTVIDKRIPPPPPPPLYLNYRTANAQPRSRRSDDNIAYYVRIILSANSNYLRCIVFKIMLVNNNDQQYVTELMLDSS